LIHPLSLPPFFSLALSLSSSILLNSSILPTLFLSLFPLSLSFFFYPLELIHPPHPFSLSLFLSLSLALSLSIFYYPLELIHPPHPSSLSLFLSLSLALSLSCSLTLAENSEWINP